jgi:hypothetical protein
MLKLPILPIKNQQSIGECEFTTYYDQVLSALFSDPDRNVLLRWLMVNRKSSVYKCELEC